METEHTSFTTLTVAKVLASLVVIGSIAAYFSPLRTLAAGAVRPKHSFVSARFPAATTRNSGTRDTLLGEVQHHTVAAQNEGVDYSLTAVKLTPAITALTADGMLLGKARGELLEEYDGERVEWEDCTWRTADCRELRYRTEGGRNGLARLLLNDDVLVTVNVVGFTNIETAHDFLATLK